MYQRKEKDEIILESGREKNRYSASSSGDVFPQRNVPRRDT